MSYDRFTKFVVAALSSSPSEKQTWARNACQPWWQITYKRETDKKAGATGQGTGPLVFNTALCIPLMNGDHLIFRVVGWFHSTS